MDLDTKTNSIRFEFPRGEKHIHFCVSIKACGNSQRVAERVAYMCFQKLQADEQMTGKDLQKFRDNLLDGYTGGPDVKDDHEAWDECRGTINHGNPLCQFVVERKGQRIAMQTTAGAAGNSMLQAERIARLCYARVLGGASKDQAIEYRNELYKKLNPAANPRKAETAPRRKSGTADEEPTAKRQKRT